VLCCLSKAALLDHIKFYFCVGEISKHGEQSINYGIISIIDLQLIINHFYKFTLKTKNLNDYKLFKLAFIIIIIIININIIIIIKKKKTKLCLSSKRTFNKGRF